MTETYSIPRAELLAIVQEAAEEAIPEEALYAADLIAIKRFCERAEHIAVGAWRIDPLDGDIPCRCPASGAGLVPDDAHNPSAAVDLFAQTFDTLMGRHGIPSRYAGTVVEVV